VTLASFLLIPQVRCQDSGGVHRTPETGARLISRARLTVDPGALICGDLGTPSSFSLIP